MAAAGVDLSYVGTAIHLKTSAARTLWRQGKSPQLDRWKQAADLLHVDVDWLLTGAGHAPPRVMERLAWLLANPDLPDAYKLSRRLPDPLDQAEADVAGSELRGYRHV